MPSANGIQRIAEQRAYPRVPTCIPAKIFIPANTVVRECTVTDLSGGGAGLQYFESAPRSELICLLTINGFGSFEGITIRQSDNMLGVRFLFGEAERRHLQEKLIAFVKEGMAAVSELHKRERGPERNQLAFIRPNGESHRCDVKNISLGGVVLETSTRPPIGELVKLARLYGRVVTHDPDGIGIQFVNFVNGAAAPAQTARPA